MVASEDGWLSHKSEVVPFFMSIARLTGRGLWTVQNNCVSHLQYPYPLKRW